MSITTVVPGHLDYLAIYNPSLGSTDETVRDQIVFYYSQKLESHRKHRSKATPGAGPRSRDQDEVPEVDNHEEDMVENERLRQVGLAQGMVSFVKNFSSGVPLESMETEKSRVVLKEVEADWWILAAVNLTQLPGNSRSTSTSLNIAKSDKNSASADTASDKNVEYSSREVAPAPLLVAQLVKAYRGFLLHHASSLAEMWKKHEKNRDFFCSLLNRYWTRFVWSWDVLLHGNPAADLHHAVKLAGGGELGVGVGEEEWGSGEREVLEDFASRTEGLVDFLVGRYGDAPLSETKSGKPKGPKVGSVRTASEPWLGSGIDCRAQDGLIFSGVGGISRPSLITVSEWMGQIFMHGESAYGVNENVTARPRHRGKRRKVERKPTQPARSQPSKYNAHEVQPRVKSPVPRGSDLRRTAMESTATPGIPAPLVIAVERSLNTATLKADTGSGNNANGNVSSREDDQSEQAGTFSSDKMMKYLSLGYGTSWTLNPKGFGGDAPPRILGPKDDEVNRSKPQPADSTIQEQLREMDPTPDVSDDESKPYVQRLEESIGKFLIGLSGDLENNEFEDGSTEEEDGDADRDGPPRQAPSRVSLRTLLVEMSSSRLSKRSAAADNISLRGRADQESDSGKGKTSAGASVDGAQPNVTHEKVQVAVYVHQPFIFVFLFQLHTSNLSMPAFYRAIHHTLGPLQKSLLRSTAPERLQERMRDTLMPASSPTPDNESSISSLNDPIEMYDLLYDPIKLTVRTSIPNIPLPGSLAAEGLHRSATTARALTVSGSWYTLGIPVGSASAKDAGSSGNAILVKSDWTRVEALNIHTHILNTWSATRDKQVGLTNPTGPQEEEKERTIKTSRGWWVVWTKVPTSNRHGSQHSSDGFKEAFLVRRSAQERSAHREASSARSDGRKSGRWLLREQPRSREVSGTQNVMSSSGVPIAKGVAEGMGIDARKWVEALSQLSL